MKKVGRGKTKKIERERNLGKGILKRKESEKKEERRKEEEREWLKRC